ncbi:F-box only protein 36-like [Rhineura floridana]|uniref:F-box only protein 36-like n=1 Tax=Rhineura floridana TaxID=261503 RepID=UPI002AC7FD47|nr:F-box only protein 36-like [Rhineura floridana]
MNENDLHHQDLEKLFNLMLRGLLCEVLTIRTFLWSSVPSASWMHGIASFHTSGDKQGTSISKGPLIQNVVVVMCLQVDYDLWQPYESVTSDSICHLGCLAFLAPYMVIWQSWRIAFRSNQERICPREVKKRHKDFLLDEQLHKQMQNVFGTKMLDYVLNLCQGHYDFLFRMPENLIIHILSFLNTEDIRQLSQTCKKFQQLCNTEEFWERRMQDKYTLDVQTVKFPAYKKPINFSQRPGYLTRMQRRQTTFF